MTALPLAFLLCFFLFIEPPAALAEDSGDPALRIVAEINGRKISAGEIEDLIHSDLYNHARSVTGSAKHDLRKQVLNRIIEHQLLETAAQKNADPNRPSANLISQYLKEEVFTDDYINEANIRDYYNSRLNEFAPPEQIRVRHIMIKAPEKPNSLLLALVKEKVDKVYILAKQGEIEFSELAKKYSQGPRRANGGDLGFITKNQLSPAFSEIIFALKVGEVSTVIEAEGGYHFFKAEDYRASKLKSLDEAREEIRNKLRERKRKLLLAQHLAKLRENSRIIVYID